MQLRVEKVSLMGTVIVPIFFMYYSIIKRRYMRNERYDNDSKFNKNLWKTPIHGLVIMKSGPLFPSMRTARESHMKRSDARLLNIRILNSEAISR